MSRQRLFESNWNATKQALLEGDDLVKGFDGRATPAKRKTMEIMLENTFNAMRQQQRLFETASYGATSAGNIAGLNKVILPVIRRVMPTVIANELIGVQPMTGPVAQIHTMRVRYADSVNAGAGSVMAGSEALSPFDIARFYTGDTSSSQPYPSGAPTSMLEGRPGPRLNIQVMRQVVEAKSRKISARWTIEAQQDAQAQQGLDIEAEIMAALAQEITAEIDQEILYSLRRLAGVPTLVFDQNQLTGTPTFIGDVHAALAIMINRQANLIAARTRRGAGNWVVVSPTALTILQSATTSAFAKSTEGVFDAPTNTKFVGTLNNSLRVYVNQYAGDNEPVLVGYKGPGEIDAAAYYCPYVPLTSSGVMMDPNTTEPVISFLARYGYVELTNTASSLGNSADYLGLVGINSNTLTFG